MLCGCNHHLHTTGRHTIMQTSMTRKLRSLPDLNFDILLQIMSLLTRQDVACLTRTCRALRVALLAELPRGEITLKGRHLASFHKFVSIKDGRDRLSYFHKLVLPGSTYDESLSSGEQAMSIRDVKRALSYILKLAASTLDSLSILDLDAFSFRPLELKKMLDSLPRLRELEMSGVDKKYQNALVDILPHLHTLTLTFLEDETNASPFFKVSKSTLQAVTLRNGTFKDASTSTSLPAVHTMRACPLKFPSDVDAYTRLFPNVRDATLDFPRDYGRMDAEFRKRMRDYHPGIEWASPYVQSWRDAFLARPQARSQAGGAWPHLQSLRAAGHGAGRLSWAGLTCRVAARLEVCCWRLLIQQLAGLLNELRPRCVVFHPSSFDGPWMGQPSGWGQLLALQGAPFVTRLVVVICRRVMCYVSKAVWLTNFYKYLEKTSVSCILLRLDYEYPVSEERSAQFETWRAAMTRDIPSLRVLLFQVEDEVVLGWAKKERRESDWKEMNEDARRKFLASENIFPTNIEPCEQCESE